MRLVLLSLATLIGLMAGAMSWLYVSDAHLAGRFLTFFQAEDPNYSNLSPPESFQGGEPWQLPQATPASLTVSPEALAVVETYADEQNSHAFIRGLK